MTSRCQRVEEACRVAQKASHGEMDVLIRRVGWLHPGRLTWIINIGIWKIIFLFKWVICMFHVNLPVSILLISM